MIPIEGYATLQEAISDIYSKLNSNGTINITANIGYGSGAKLNSFDTADSSRNIAINLNDKTYTFGINPVGSSGTETNSLQLLKNNNITIKNGTIDVYADNLNSKKFKILIQNYSNLTLDNVKLDGSNIVPGNYTSSNNNGNVQILNSEIIAPKGGVAFDVYYWPGNGYTDGVSVTVKNSIISGRIEVDSDGTQSNIGEKTNKLTIIGGEKSDLVGTSKTGGGSKIYNDGYTTLENVTLKENQATSGAAVYNVGGTMYAGVLTATNVQFAQNTATQNGGAIYSTGGSVTINGNTSFTNNEATLGGAIYAENATLTLNATNKTDKIEFSGNTLKEGGAGSDLYLVNTPVTMTGAGTISFDGSIVGDAASSITSSAANVTIKDASGFKGSYQVTGGSFTAEKIEVAAGEAFQATNSTVNITNLTLADETESSDGGQLLVIGGQTTIGTLTVNNDSGESVGAVILPGDNGKAQVATFINNCVNYLGNNVSVGSLTNATTGMLLLTDGTAEPQSNSDVTLALTEKSSNEGWIAKYNGHTNLNVGADLTNKGLIYVDNLTVENGTLTNAGQIAVLNKLTIGNGGKVKTSAELLKGDETNWRDPTNYIFGAKTIDLNEGGTLKLTALNSNYEAGLGGTGTDKDQYNIQYDVNLNGGALVGPDEKKNLNIKVGSQATAAENVSTVLKVNQGEYTFGHLTLGNKGVVNVADDGSLTITGNTTVHTGATFTNEGTITFTGGEFNGSLNKNIVDPKGTVIIAAGENGTFTNKGQLDGDIFKLESGKFIATAGSHDHFNIAYWNGGEYHDTDLSSIDLDTAICDSGIDYLAGTKLTYKKADGSTAYITKLEVKKSDQQGEEEITGKVYVQAAYNNEQFKEVTVSDGQLILGDGDEKAGSFDLDTFTQSGGETTVYKNGTLKTDTLTQTGGTLNVSGLLSVGKLDWTGGQTIIKEGGTLDVTSATLKGESLKGTTAAAGGTVAGLSGQFFENSLGADGLTQNSGAYDGHGLKIEGGTLTIKDAKYNLAYAGAAGLATNNAFKIIFTGSAVTPPTPVIPTPEPDPENPNVPGDIVIDNSTGTGTGTGSGTGTGTEGGTGSTGIEISTDNKITADDVNNTEGIGNVIMTEVVMSTKKDDDSLTKDDLIIGSANTADGDDESKTNVVKSNLGVKAVEVSASSQNVKVNDGKVLTLVGGGEGDLIQGSEKDVTLKIGDSKSVGYVQLGVKAEGVKNGGTLNTDVEIRQGSLLAVSAGTFEAPKQIKTAGVVTVADNSALKVNNLVVEGNFSSVQVSGTLEVATLGDKDTTAGAGVIYVGNAETNGSVKVGTSHGGHRFFLDPAFNDKGIEGASNLVYGDAAVVDKILVGENSYAVIGATDDAEFVETFKRSGLTWGADGVKAALFVGQPITINATTGGLTIDGTKTEWTEPAANSVSITNDSVVIADVTKLNATGSGSLINAGTITVGEKAKAILVNVQSGTEYSLVSNGTGFAADNIVAANAMFGIAAGAGSSSDKAVFDLQGAQSIYGNLMQGQALADAAMQSASSSDAYQYVNGLLTDVNGDIEAAAARFDAAMNPAGTLGVFTTALDRATELTNAVREEAGAAQQPRLWAKVSGGKTKLDGLSTKAQSLDLKTSAYGLIVGGEAPVNGTVLGAAFSAGSGDTKNDSLSGKDEFDYYGLSAYAQREIAGITFTGDIGAAWLSSELTVGAADVKNDADTAVYKLGIEGKKAFDLGSAIVTPFVGLDVYHIKADSYKTNHDVQVASSDATVVEMPIGAQIKGSFETAQGMTVVPSFSFAVVPMLGDKDIDSKVKFAGAESSYNFTFADDVKVRTNFAVNAETKNFRFGAHLGFEWGNEERQSFSGGVKASYLF